MRDGLVQSAGSLRQAASVDSYVGEPVSTMLERINTNGGICRARCCSGLRSCGT